MEKNQKIKAALFDLDGTLIDTAPDFVISLNNILKRHGLPCLDSSLIRSHVSDGSAKLTSLGFGIEKDDPDFHKLRKEFLDEYKINLLKNSFLFLGIDKLIQFLLDNKIKFGIVTNKPRAYAEPLVGNFKELEKSEILICSDDIAEPKPSPEGINVALKYLNVSSSETLYIGDHINDLNAGARSGAKIIACYYGYSLNSRNNPYSCDAANNVEDLIKIISKSI